MKQNFSNCLRLFLILEMLFLAAAVAQPVRAHTEDAVVQLSLEPVGPYAMTVWTYPGTMRAGSVHYTVAVLDTAVAQPLNDATILITATPLDGQGETVTGQARQGLDSENPAFYELDLTLAAKGAYQIDVQLTDSLGQSWTKDFQVEVVSATLIKWITLFLLVQALSFTLWLMRESIQTWGLRRLIAPNAGDWQKTRSRARRPI